MIYFDYAASTPVDPDVLAAMLPYFGEHFANPSSGHVAGRTAGDAIERARRTLGGLVGLPPASVVFTAGGTEADVLAVRGAVAGAGRPVSVVVSAVEHPAVLETARSLAADGVELRVAGVDRGGRVDPDAVGDLVDASTAIVSIMHVNNETGAVQPTVEWSRAVKAKNSRTRTHVDAVQAFGKYPVSFAVWPDVDLVSVSAHKIYGPKGSGALFVRPGTALGAILTGGGQEAGLRSGTQNVPGIVGLAESATRAVARADTDMAHYAGLARRLLDGIAARGIAATLNGVRDETAPYARRAPYIVNLRFPGMTSDVLFARLALHGIEASAGSACHTGETNLSHVLVAMGCRPEDGAPVRVSFGRAITAADIDALLDGLASS